ncbi:hypothetical protein BT63DRAFT_438869 [Microthyrium microscopicum]|uniref:Uncharacterized protein n=1 Tax=Microthyrium microscopicum TaxID=703497 RepID=A0A6A6UGN0_9PEZI|nr:hypothetical protein BT63DRAFT_438869 [Microthyrium microscopicum]
MDGIRIKQEEIEYKPFQNGQSQLSAIAQASRPPIHGSTKSSNAKRKKKARTFAILRSLNAQEQSHRSQRTTQLSKGQKARRNKAARKLKLLQRTHNTQSQQQILQEPTRIARSQSISLRIQTTDARLRELMAKAKHNNQQSALTTERVDYLCRLPLALISSRFITGNSKTLTEPTTQDDLQLWCALDQFQPIQGQAPIDLRHRVNEMLKEINNKILELQAQTYRDREETRSMIELSESLQRDIRSNEQKILAEAEELRNERYQLPGNSHDGQLNRPTPDHTYVKLENTPESIRLIQTLPKSTTGQAHIEAEVMQEPPQCISILPQIQVLTAGIKSRSELDTRALKLQRRKETRRKKQETRLKLLLERHEEGNQPLSLPEQHTARNLSLLLGPPWIPFQVQKPSKKALKALKASQPPPRSELRKMKVKPQYPDWYQRVRLWDQIGSEDFEEDLSELKSDENSCDCGCEHVCKAWMRTQSSTRIKNYPQKRSERKKKLHVDNVQAQRATEERKQVQRLETRIEYIKKQSKQSQNCKPEGSKEKASLPALRSEKYRIYTADYTHGSLDGLHDIKHLELVFTQDLVGGYINFNGSGQLVHIDDFVEPEGRHDRYNMSCSGQKYGISARFYAGNYNSYVKLVMESQMVMRLLSSDPAELPPPDMPELLTFVGACARPTR